MLWELIVALLTAIGSIVGSAWAIKQVIKHEEKACDARFDAFKEGLDRHEKDK